MIFRRIIQIISLSAFLALLSSAVWGFTLFSDMFLRLDPVLIMLSAVSGRTFSTAFLPCMAVLLISPIIGRIFCGYICPMGTSIDAGDAWLGSSGKAKYLPENLYTVKYLIFAFLLGASFLGISFIFAASPLSLITRFYGLLIYPVLSFFAGGILNLAYPLADKLDSQFLMFVQIKSPKFASGLFILLFFTAVFAAAKISPRFWCRYLCPSGALMALFSKKPFIRRQVSRDCTNCGKCARQCPMNAIDPDMPEITRHQECIVCRKCENICPVNAVSFSALPVKKADAANSLFSKISINRRKFIYSGISGACTAVVCLTGLNSVYGKAGEGQVLPPGLIRPPGALPEPDFLSLCVRCGECIAVCPTNTLQPIWFEAGFTGIFSPALTPRRKYCDPRCKRCGEVCPTGAIHDLPENERIWAKTGTAVIFRQKCLAWEYQKSCMVCDEVCPFDAIDFKIEQGNPYPVPHVIEDRCAGCGYCEHACPVQNQAAIIITPMGALRLKEVSFEIDGKSQGLDLQLRPKKMYHSPVSGAENSGDIAPGFDLGE